MTMHSTLRPDRRPSRLWRIALIFCLELVLLATAYQFLTTIDCQQTGLFGTCRFLRSLVARALVVFAAFGLMVWARPAAFAAFRRMAEATKTARGGLALHLLGLALLALPLFAAPNGDVGAVFALALWPLTLGSLLAAVGGLLWLAPAAAWRQLLGQDRGLIPLVLLIAALLPDAADMAQRVWNWDVVTRITFDGVHLFLRLFSDQVTVDPRNYNIGFPEFTVNIAPQCSGVEGIALVTAFSLLYMLIFRETVRFPQIWIILPVAILLSWLLNIVRIGALIVIGRAVSPDLAVNGFHSYAGWMFFTLLALGIVWGVQALPWLHKAASVPETGLRDDPVAAMLLPFAAFMLASLLTHAFFPHPELGYPLRVGAMILALLPFRQFYRRFEWRVDPVAVCAGIAVGAGWVALDQGSGTDGMELAAALATLPLWAFWLWILLRLIGTVLLVPLVEELAFRGYLLTRLDGPGLLRRALAVGLSSAAFAALHGRWIEAGGAGIVFALLALWRGRLSDAVVGHLAANLIVAVWALATSDFTLI